MKPLYTDTTVLVEDTEGHYMSVRVKLDTCTEKVRLQMYCRNKHWYSFFFTLTNDKDKDKKKQKLKHHYFVVRRSVNDVIEMGQNNTEPIIKMEQDITVFTTNDFSSREEKVNLENYTRQMTFKDLIEL